MKAPALYSEDDATDDMARGYRGIPDDKKLRGLSYIALCGLLADSELGSQKYFIVEAEKRRRDAEPIHAVKPSGGVPMNWYERPIGKTWLAVVGVVLGAMTLYLLRNHLGMPI